jgi:glycosyltransferase involved in cell wall biosynthesis
MLRQAVGVVAVATPAATVLVQRFGVPPERMTVIPTGASAARFAPYDPAARHRARATLDIPASAAVVVLVGALSPEKNVALAIDATATAAAGDWVLLVVGDGPERAALEARAALTAPERVRFLGSLADPAPAYAAADVVLLSSRTEALPAVLIEAGLLGLPVVCTDVGFVREVVVDGVTGLLVPPDDPNAMAAAVVRARHHAQALGAAAREHCLARFELGVVAAQWEAAIREWSTPGPDDHSERSHAG